MEGLQLSRRNDVYDKDEINQRRQKKKQKKQEEKIEETKDSKTRIIDAASKLKENILRNFIK